MIQQDEKFPAAMSPRGLLLSDAGTSRRSSTIPRPPLRGDILVLGVGGKMVPHFSPAWPAERRMPPGISRRVIGVAAFFFSLIRKAAHNCLGSRTIRCDCSTAVISPLFSTPQHLSTWLE